MLAENYKTNISKKSTWSFQVEKSEVKYKKKQQQRNPCKTFI